MIQDGGLRKKSMRKTIDRVDLGWYAKPMQVHAWHRKKRSTWAGWGITAGVQAVIGLALFTLGALVFGAPFNAITILLAIGFATGCAIGDPISFLLWTFLFVEISGTVSGILAGAWFNLPSWWHALAAAWRDGQSVSPIFVGAVPVWMFVWIMGGRGVAKGFDILIEQATLKFGYDLAKRFMSDEDLLRASAYEESGVSDMEAQRHFDVTDRDGTQAIIAGQQPRIYETEERPAPAPTASAPTPEPAASSSGGYMSYFDDEDLNPDASRRAAAGVSMGGGPVSVDLGKPDGVSLDKAEDAPKSFLMETNLPAPPVEEATAPVQRAETPKLDARANRAMQRQMSALLLSFESVMTDEELGAFANDHRDVLMGLSDDQQRLLDTMDGGQALIAMSRRLQSDDAVNFIAGISDDSGPSEDLSLITDHPLPVQAAAVDMSGASVGETDEERSEASGDQEAQPKGTSDVMALAGALEAFMPSRRGDRAVSFVKRPSFDDEQGAPPAEIVAETPREKSDAPESGAEDEAAQPDPDPLVAVGGEEGGAPLAQPEESVQSDPATDAEAPRAEIVDAVADASHGDTAPVAETDAAPDASGEADATSSDGVQHSDVVAEDAGAARTETVAEGAAEDHEGEDGGKPRRLALSEGEFAFEVDDEVIAEHPPMVGVDGSGTEEVSENMASYSRDEVLLVRGLLAAKESAQDKARNVQEFQEAHPELTVSDVVGSRSFVEFLGDQDAASVRHSWREVQSIIAAPPSERLGREFDRLNQRGQKFLEEPHLLDRPLFNHWEQEVLRIRGAAAAVPDLLTSLSKHISMNVSIGDSMRELLDKRDAAAADPEHRMDTMPTVSQKVPKREVALRGHRMLSSMFRPGAGPREELPMTDARRPETLAIDTSATPDAATLDLEASSAVPAPSPYSEEPISQDSAAGEDMSSDRGPVPGEEDFVSKHPVGTPAYRRDMATHEALLKVAREEREEAERAAEAERTRESERRIAAEAADDASRERIRQQAEESARLEGEEKVRKASAEAAAAEAEAERATAAARAAEAEARVAKSREDSEAEIRGRTEVETMFLSAAKRAHSQLFAMPQRFHTPDILAAYISYEEISSYRKGLALVSKPSASGHDPLKRNDAVGRARAETAARALVQFEVIVGEAAKAVLSRIVTTLGGSEGQDVMEVLEEGPEKVFVARLQSAVESGEKAVTTLNEVEKADREIERLAEGSRGMDDLQKELREALDRVGVLMDEKKTFEEQLGDANSARETAETELTRLRREIAGELDDEFQKVLDDHATHIDDMGVNGFYKYVSPDRRSCFVIITAKASSFPDGTVDVGDHSMSVSDVIDFAEDKAKTFRAKPEILYVDSGMRPHMAGRGSLIGRDAGQLRSSLNIPG